jgi:GTPase SAR1 family protein
MIGLVKGVFASWYAKEEIRILLLGADGSGKSVGISLPDVR